MENKTYVKGKREGERLKIYLATIAVLAINVTACGSRSNHKRDDAAAADPSPISVEPDQEPADTTIVEEEESGSGDEEKTRGIDPADFGENLFVDTTTFALYTLPGFETYPAESNQREGRLEISAIGGVSDQSAWLRIHNVKRCMHGLAPLKWNATAAASAQRWANSCRFEHERQAPYGDNLAWGTAGWFTPERAGNLWYRESQGYPYGVSTPPFSTMHFTQMVWRETSEVGCARATCSYGTYFVCRYTKRGNYLGQFGKNVPRTIKTEAQCAAGN